VVGLGAVKYADLLPNRQSDYVFSWDKMLALQGNTRRICNMPIRGSKASSGKASYMSLKNRRMGARRARPPKWKYFFVASEEIALARQLLNFGLALEAVAEEFRPNFLCNYLYELASKFTSFYENCPVLKADDATRASRLALCDLTARVLKQGLEILGIETVN